MRNEDKKTIEITAHTTQPIDDVWKHYHDPESIKQWNFADESWETSDSFVNLVEGGTFKHHMQAKDKSMGFDFSGTYLSIKPPYEVVTMLDDGRKVWLSLEEQETGVAITQRFEIEDIHTSKQQQQGWQNILNNFVTFLENTAHKTNSLRIQNYLIYPNRAKEAVEFYAQHLPQIIIESTSEISDPWNNRLDLVEFSLCNTSYVAMDGGDHFQMSDAYSIALIFEHQEELDRVWDAFTKKGRALQCGWLVDEFGLSWQLIPEIYFELLKTSNLEAKKRVEQKVFDSIKLDAKELLDAFKGE